MILAGPTCSISSDCGKYGSGSWDGVCKNNKCYCSNINCSKIKYFFILILSKLSVKQ